MEECYLVKLQAKACNLTKSNSPPWAFFTFFKFANGTKSREAPHIWSMFLFYGPYFVPPKNRKPKVF